MASSYYDRVRFQSAAVGTAAFTVNAAITGYRTPTFIPDGTAVSYAAETADLTQWEVGHGTWHSGTMSISRDNPIVSSGGLPVTFVQAPVVWLDLIAEDISFGGNPGGINGQIQYNNAGSFGGFTAIGDVSITPSTGATTVNSIQGTTVSPPSGSATTYLDGTGHWSTPTGAGNVVGSGFVNGGVAYSTGGLNITTTPLGTTSQILIGGATPSWSSSLPTGVTINLGSGTFTGQLPVASGGTGVGTLTGLLQGNGTSAFTAITNSSTVGQVLRVTGASTYAWGALDLSSANAVTNALGPTNGGTGQSTYTLGDTLYSSATNTLAKLAGNTTSAKQYLSQTGTGTVSAAPVWATIAGGDITGAALTTANDTNVTITASGTPATALLRASLLTMGWTGTLAVSRGGTGLGTLTANGVMIGNGTSAPTFATGTTAQIMIGGSPPSFTGTFPAAITIPVGQITGLSGAAVTSLTIGTFSATPNANALTLSGSTGALTLTATVFGASGAGHAPGHVPDPGSTAGTTRFLREDATWFVPPGGGGGTPGGPNTSIQFNNSGAFGGSSNLVWTGTQLTDALALQVQGHSAFGASASVNSTQIVATQETFSGDLSTSGGVRYGNFVFPVFTHSGASTTVYEFGGYFHAQNTGGSNVQQLIGVNCLTEQFTATILDRMCGFEGVANVQSGTTTLAYGVNANVVCTGGTVSTLMSGVSASVSVTAGTVSDLRGVSVLSPSFSGGTISGTASGIFINDWSSISGGWNIYSGGTGSSNFMQGKLQVQGHSAFGASASIAQDAVFEVSETFTGNLSTNLGLGVYDGIRATTFFNNTSGSVALTTVGFDILADGVAGPLSSLFGASCEARLEGSTTTVSNAAIGVNCLVNQFGTNVSLPNLTGAQFQVNVQASSAGANNINGGIFINNISKTISAIAVAGSFQNFISAAAATTTTVPQLYGATIITPVISGPGTVTVSAASAGLVINDWSSIGGYRGNIWSQGSGSTNLLEGKLQVQGHSGFGASGSTSISIVLDVEETITANLSTAITWAGEYLKTTYVNSSGTTSTSLYGELVNSFVGASNTNPISALVSVAGVATNSGTGSVSQLIGVQGSVTQSAGAISASTIGLYAAYTQGGGTNAAAYGVYVGSPSVTGGTLTSATGVYCDDQSAYGQNIYSRGVTSINVFDGQNRVGLLAMNGVLPGSQVVPANYGVYAVDNYEITSGLSLELASGAAMEIG